MFALKNNRTRTINFGISSESKLKLFLCITLEIDQKWFLFTVIGTFISLTRDSFKLNQAVILDHECLTFFLKTRTDLFSNGWVVVETVVDVVVSSIGGSEVIL